MMEKSFGNNLIVGFSGIKAEETEVLKIREFILEGQVQGVILFSHNIINPKQLRDLTSFFRKAKEDLIIAVDQEGGAVQRLKKKQGFTDYPSPEAVASALDYHQAKNLYAHMADELISFGINYNFAPCIDINPKHIPLSPIIGELGRSYGGTTAAALYAKAFIEAHEEKGVRTCLKHYPGHGSAQGDTHHGFVDVSSVWHEEEIDIFGKLVRDTSVDGVMTGHISHTKWGEEPATFCKEVIDILRKEYGFMGTIFSDDLHMGAILEKYTFEESLKKAYDAGINGFIYSSNKNATGGHSFVSSVELIPRFWRFLNTLK